MVYCWENNEQLLSREIQLDYNPFTLRKRIQTILACYIVLELTNQINYRLSNLADIRHCTNFHDRAQALFNLDFPELFDVIYYHEIFGVLAYVISIFAGFCRGFTDIVLIAIFLALKEQFWILNKSVSRTPINVS